MQEAMVGEWVKPRGSLEPVIPQRRLRIDVDTTATYTRYLTSEELQRDFLRLLATDPTSLVFLTGPLTGRRNPETLQLSEGDKQRIRSIEGFFNPRGFLCYHAHGRQDFGRLGITSHAATKLDSTALERAGMIVTLPWASTSPNTRREVDLAVAYGKPLILFYEEGQEDTFMKTVMETVLESPASFPPSAFIPVNGTTDLSPHLERLLV